MKTKLDRIMDFYADNFIPIFGGFFLMLPVLAVTLQACDNMTPEERAESNAQYTDELKIEMTTFNPRDGVECYVIRGRSSTNPRTMSCVVLPEVTK